VPACTLLFYLSVLFEITLPVKFIYYQISGLEKNSIPHAFDFDILLFLLAGKKVSQGSDVFAVFHHANHDLLNLSFYGALSSITPMPS
jgi:hypothetical protein